MEIHQSRAGKRPRVGYRRSVGPRPASRAKLAEISGAKRLLPRRSEAAPKDEPRSPLGLAVWGEHVLQGDIGASVHALAAVLMIEIEDDLVEGIPRLPRTASGAIRPRNWSAKSPRTQIACSPQPRRKSEDGGLTKGAIRTARKAGQGRAFARLSFSCNAGWEGTAPSYGGPASSMLLARRADRRSDSRRSRRREVSARIFGLRISE